MTKRPDEVQDPTGQQRFSGQPTTRQGLVVIAAAAVIASFGSGFLGLELLPQAVVVFLGTIVLGIVGTMIVRRFNRRRG
jgi:putative Mn2+ efflux pump MntP